MWTKDLIAELIQNTAETRDAVRAINNIPGHTPGIVPAPDRTGAIPDVGDDFGRFQRFLIEGGNALDTFTKRTTSASTSIDKLQNLLAKIGQGGPAAVAAGPAYVSRPWVSPGGMQVPRAVQEAEARGGGGSLAGVLPKNFGNIAPEIAAQIEQAAKEQGIDLRSPAEIKAAERSAQQAQRFKLWAERRQMMDEDWLARRENRDQRAFETHKEKQAKRQEIDENYAERLDLKDARDAQRRQEHQEREEVRKKRAEQMSGLRMHRARIQLARSSPAFFHALLTGNITNAGLQAAGHMWSIQRAFGTAGAGVAGSAGGIGLSPTVLAGIAAAGVGAAIAFIVKSPDIIRDSNEHRLAFDRHATRFDTLTQLEFAQGDVSQIGRDIRIGSGIAASTRELIHAQQALKEAMVPLDQAGGNLSNFWGTFTAGIGERIAKTIAPIAGVVNDSPGWFASGANTFGKNIVDFFNPFGLFTGESGWVNIWQRFKRGETDAEMVERINRDKALMNMGPGATPWGAFLMGIAIPPKKLGKKPGAP